MKAIGKNSLTAYTFKVDGVSKSFIQEKDFVQQTAFYAVIFTAVYCACTLIGKFQYASYLVLAINLFLSVLGIARKAVLYSSFLLGNELASFVNILIGLIALQNEKKKNDKKDGTGIPPIIGVLVFCLLAVTVVNTLALGTFVNAISSVAYYGFLAFLFYRLNGVYEKKELLVCTKAFAYGELAIIFASCLIYGFIPGDANCGSLGNAHFLGVWCGMAIIVLFACRRPWGKDTSIAEKILSLLPFCALLISFYYSDTKAAVLCGVAGVVLALLVRLLFKTKTVVPALLSFMTVFLALIVFLSMPAVEEDLTEKNAPGATFFTLYVYSDDTALKFDYFEDTTHALLSDEKIVTGYGLGQYGSRFANLYGYSFAFRGDNAMNQIIPKLFESRMLDDYKEHASRYDENFVANIMNYSAVSAYPFSSLMSFIAEGGLVGLILLCLVLRYLRPDKNAQFLIMFFVGCCAMDLYLDHIQLIGYLVLALAVLRERCATEPQSLVLCYDSKMSICENHLLLDR